MTVPTLSRVYGRMMYRLAVGVQGQSAVYDYLRQLHTVERGSADALETTVRTKLAALLSHAQARSAGYPELGQQGAISPDNARSILARLTPLTKSRLQQDAAQLRVAGDVGPTRSKTTGGSTGQAVTVVKNVDAIAHEMAASWLAYGWFGIEIGDRAARFWGSPTTWKRRMRSTAANLAMNRLSFSAFAFGSDDLDQYWKRCVMFRPQYLYGYASMLATFARHIEERGYDGSRLGLRAVVSTSEVLSLPQRAQITRGLACPVQNEYGCGEVGPIAYECEHGMLHVMSTNVLVEVLTEGGTQAVEGESGAVHITDLNNLAMPLIRYRIADNAEVGGPCRCGRPFPTLRRVWGREYDFVETMDGRRYHGEYFMYLFEDLNQRGLPVEQFQVVQTGPAAVHLRLRRADIGAEALGAIVAEAKKRLPSVAISVEVVESIPLRASGKTAIILNEWRKPDASISAV